MQTIAIGASALLVLAAAGEGCSGDPDAERTGSAEKTGSTEQAITAPPRGTDPEGTPFFYFRSNSTDWGVDEGSRLLPTQNPAVFARTITYSLTYDDSASLTETIATAPDEWGNKQTFFSTPSQSTFVVPNTVTLVPGSTEKDFHVHYPHTGQYVVSFDTSAQALTIVPVGQDAGTDSGSDASADSGTDGGPSPWQPLTHQPTFGADTPYLLTDGRVMVHSAFNGDWWALTPDANGSYVNGTWSQLASLPSTYGPEYFGSAVLPDGRLVVEGGEYNFGVQDWTNLGAIYDPIANTWTSVSAPSGWNSIGDAPSAVLASGTFMLGDSLSARQALFNAAQLSWSPTGTGKLDGNNEEGWTLLPNGKLLTVDVTAPQSELYDPATGSWTSAGSTIVTLVGAGSEIGPAVLMPNGVVFAVGGSQHTALYNSSTGVWSVGPDFPAVASGQLDVADGPASLLPNGRVLVAASPGLFMSDVHFFEFDGSALHEVGRTPNAPTSTSFQIRLLILPTGQILETDDSSDVEIYTPTGGPQAAWAPTITSVASTLTRGSTAVIHGTQFNGLSQGNMYGDDVQDATNYPLVRITNVATGHVFYTRTHGHSTMAVATGSQIVSTSFDVPAGADTGASRLVVVANGIASSPVSVTVQ
jgi:hypothetical protein